MKKILIAIVLLMSLQAADPHPSARLNWQWSQGTGDAASGFHVWRANVTGGPYTLVATVTPATTLTYLDTTVVAGSTYFYTVSTFNAGGDSSKAPEVSCTIPFQAPASPTSLSAVTQ
jgi:fibronectin type 3 domain-containing protein